MNFGPDPITAVSGKYKQEKTGDLKMAKKNNAKRDAFIAKLLAKMRLEDIYTARRDVDSEYYRADNKIALRWSLS